MGKMSWDRTALLAAAFSLCSVLCAEGSAGRKKFVRGNLADKTAAVKDASPSEAAVLSRAAVDFAVENRELLGDDRDLAALAVAGVLALPAEAVSGASPEEKERIEEQLLALFNLYGDTVKISVLNRLSPCGIPTERFSETLDSFMGDEANASRSGALVRAAVAALGEIGTENSFTVLYGCLDSPRWAPYRKEIGQAAGRLSEKAFSEVVGIIRRGDTAECRRIFDMICQNKTVSQVFQAETAENTLSQTIYIAEKASSADSELVALQLDSLRILTESEWTRASKTVTAFFDTAVSEYESGGMGESDFIEVIAGTARTAPMDAARIFSGYLAKLNQSMESASGRKPAEKVVLTIISALGGIGDKYAFDSLLSVTYYNYPDHVIAAARDALAELKW